MLPPIWNAPIWKGGHWSGKLASPYLVTAPATQKAVQPDCWVALFDGHLQAAEALKPLLELVAQQETPHLLFVAHEMGSEVVNLLAGTHRHPKNKLKLVATSIKLGGESGRVELDDLALLTGATVLGGLAGEPLAKVDLTHLGQAKRVESDKDGMYVVQGGGDKRAIREAIETLQARLGRDDLEDSERETLQKRLGRLSGSSGVLKIGALTKPERDVLRQKAEQGVKVAVMALTEGILPGGGIAFVRAGAAIDLDTALNEDERMGMIATQQALAAPFKRIFANAQMPAAALALQDTLAAGEGHVYDVVQERIVPAQEAGIMDAAQVLRRVLTTAASGAEMALSVDVTVLKKRPVTTINYEP